MIRMIAPLTARSTAACVAEAARLQLLEPLALPAALEDALDPLLRALLADGEDLDRLRAVLRHRARAAVGEERVPLGVPERGRGAQRDQQTDHDPQPSHPGSSVVNAAQTAPGRRR